MRNSPNASCKHPFFHAYSVRLYVVCSVWIIGKRLIENNRVPKVWKISLTRENTLPVTTSPRHNIIENISIFFFCHFLRFSEHVNYWTKYLTQIFAQKPEYLVWTRGFFLWQVIVEMCDDCWKMIIARDLCEKHIFQRD